MHIYKNIIKILSILILCKNIASAQSIWDNTYDKGSQNEIPIKEKNKIAIVDAKHMNPFDILTYTGNSPAGQISNGAWQILQGHGYGHISSPFFKNISDVPYSIRIEYEVAANFDTKSNQSPYAYIDVLNNHEIIYRHPINTERLGSIDRYGVPQSYQKIVFTVSEIPYAHNLQPRLFLNYQYNKTIYIKSIKAFLIKYKQ